MEQPVSGFGDNWRSYFAFMEYPLHICYDATVKQLSERIRKRYPDTLLIEIPFTEENENKYPPNAESDWIFDISENLFCGRFDVRMIGIIIGPFWGRIALCCNIKEKKVLKLVTTLFERIDVAMFRHQFISDDNFAYYHTVLTPPYYEDNCMKNRMLCNRLSENGEAFQEPRTIDFLCCFSDSRHIQHIVDQLTDQFREYGFQEVERTKKDDGKYWLDFTLEGIPALGWIHETTCRIIHLLEGTDGYFDGWGCLVVKGDDA